MPRRHGNKHFRFNLAKSPFAADKQQPAKGDLIAAIRSMLWDVAMDMENPGEAKQ